jgi:pheromone shutdown-related protein TraB
VDFENLPESVTVVEDGGKRFFLVGTAHVSRESVEDVRRTVDIVRPDSICVELCPARHQAMTRRDDWKRMDIYKVIKDGKAVFLMVQLVLQAFYRKIGDKLGVQPGAEMMEGVRLADETGATLVLADRDVQVTLKRVWGFLGFWKKFQLLSQLLTSVFVDEDVDKALIEDMKKKDQLDAIMGSFGEKFPQIKERLIDERDIYLAQKIRKAPGENIVAVVGAGHVPGMQKYFGQEIDLAPLEELPPPSKWGAFWKWGLPGFFVALLVIGFFRGGADASVDALSIWVLVTGIGAALGSVAAFGHPLTVLSSFLAAPITTLHPLIAAGWVAGLVQAWVKKPTVSDLEELPMSVMTVKGFWLNPVSRILLVVIFVNLGATIGVFVSSSWIASRVF